MSEPSESELFMRLRRLPGQLLLSLVNGTAILVIAAAILAIVASSKVTHLAQNASTMTDAVLSRVDGDPRQAVRNIQRLSDDVHKLVITLKQAKVDGIAGLDPEIARLSERLSALDTNTGQLRDARSRLIDELIAKVGTSVSEGLQNFRACSKPAQIRFIPTN
jgi:hypothetical protein